MICLWLFLHKMLNKTLNKWTMTDLVKSGNTEKIAVRASEVVTLRCHCKYWLYFILFCCCLSPTLVIDTTQCHVVTFQDINHKKIPVKLKRFCQFPFLWSQFHVIEEENIDFNVYCSYILNSFRFQRNFIGNPDSLVNRLRTSWGQLFRSAWVISALVSLLGQSPMFLQNGGLCWWLIVLINTQFMMIQSDSRK